MGIVALGQGRSAGTSNLSDPCFPIPSVGKKGLTYPHRALQQSQPLGKEHEWAENQTFNHLCREGVNLPSVGSAKAGPMARAGLAEVLGLAQGLLDYFILFHFLPRCLTEL